MIFASAAHAPAMAAIHEASFPPSERWGAEAIRGLLDMPGVFALLDAEGGFILARVAADEAEILTLAVVPHARRQGLGHRLLAAAMAEARARGAHTLFLEVARDNKAALGLYAAAGFAEIGARAEYYPSGGDALVLRAVL